MNNVLVTCKLRDQKVTNTILGGGNSNILIFTPNVWGNGIQFDLRIFFRWVGKNHQLVIPTLPLRNKVWEFLTLDWNCFCYTYFFTQRCFCYTYFSIGWNWNFCSKQTSKAQQLGVFPMEASWKSSMPNRWEPRGLGDLGECLRIQSGAQTPARWWFQIFVIFTPYLESSILSNIFQMGWNHQPASYTLRFQPPFKHIKTLGGC